MTAGHGRARGDVDDRAAVAVCDVEDVPTGGCLAVADARVLLSRVDGEVVAWRNRCLHRDAPLARRRRPRRRASPAPSTSGATTWPTGRNLTSGAPLEPVPVAIDDGVVVVVPPPRPPTDLRALLLDHARTWTRDPDATEAR